MEGVTGMEMCNWDEKEVARLERLRGRTALRRRMLEKQAVNDPNGFDFWADQIDACDEELRRIAAAILGAKGIQ